MGSDLTVVNAARVSHHKESEWITEPFYGTTGDLLYYDDRLSERDTKLIHYLAAHKHWTPFAHPQLSFRVKAPIFVRAQLFKHKQGLVENEVSRRYVDEEPEFYLPDYFRKRANNVKQGSATDKVESLEVWDDVVGPTGNVWDDPVQFLDMCHDRMLVAYKSLLKAGVCPEQARMVLPQSLMTEWVWTGSLAAFSRVCKLRLDPHTQQETRDVARMLADLIEPFFPVSWKALGHHSMEQTDTCP